MMSRELLTVINGGQTAVTLKQASPKTQATPLGEALAAANVIPMSPSRRRWERAAKQNALTPEQMASSLFNMNRGAGASIEMRDWYKTLLRDAVLKTGKLSLRTGSFKVTLKPRVAGYVCVKHRLPISTKGVPHADCDCFAEQVLDEPVQRDVVVTLFGGDDIGGGAA
jgi:hypothetical protein